MNRMHRPAFFVISLVLLAGPMYGDEGMWPLNRLPAEYLDETYAFKPDDAWIEQVQKSCLRVGKGGSASFVSPDGLIMTNHHVGLGAIADLSTADRDLLKHGFYAPTRDQELACPGRKMYQLISIQDVTDRVDAGEARAKAIAAITREAKERTGLQPEMVKLYHGARYHLYLYQVYEDVRLVMAPEGRIAFFGGDIDNFGYPRFDLDICFFRVYEDGKPASTPHHFTWSTAGAAPHELVFVAGHPARTRRMFTKEHLEFLRDVDVKLILEVYNQLEVALIQFTKRGAECERTGGPVLKSVQNGRKAYNGIIGGLMDARIMERKAKKQQALREWVLGDEARRTRYGDPWEDLAAALKDVREIYPAYFLLENRRSRMGDLFKAAKQLVRAAHERAKPDAERLPEFREVELKSLESTLFTEAPVYKELEECMLADALARFARVLGGGHPTVEAALDGSTPDARASSIVGATRLDDIALRRKLYVGGLEAIQSCKDPMIELASILEPFAREYRSQYEEEFQSVETDAYTRIAKALFEKYGESIYPDATHTLRLSIGTVKGYTEKGIEIPPTTTMAGAFRHADEHDHAPPFDMPERWMIAKEKLNPRAPFNFVSTCDIIGGNSGSPAFNRSREIVGIIFDGNIQSLVWDIEFDQRQARAVSVHSQGIIEALRKVYEAGALADELTGGNR